MSEPRDPDPLAGINVPRIRVECAVVEALDALDKVSERADALEVDRGRTVNARDPRCPTVSGRGVETVRQGRTVNDPTWDMRTVPRGRRQRRTWVLHFADLEDEWIPEIADTTLTALVRDRDVCRGLAALVGALAM